MSTRTPPSDGRGSDARPYPARRVERVSPVRDGRQIPSTRTPVYFVPHGGGPWPFMRWNPPDAWARLDTFLRGLGAQIGEKPKAVVIVSGHWEERAFTLQNGERPPMLYDYSGFPAETYKVQYPAPGAPAVAERAADLLKAAGLDAALNATRGFDHGVFVPLSLVYPEADVPVVQLSLARRFDPELHLAAGRALQPLRDEGVLIMGAGMSFHNMAGFGRMKAEAKGFDDWLTAAVGAPMAAREQALRAWAKAPYARACHPREEHLLPLLVAAGAAGADAGKKVLEDLAFGTVNSGFRFG